MDKKKIDAVDHILNVLERIQGQLTRIIEEFETLDRDATLATLLGHINLVRQLIVNSQRLELLEEDLNNG